MADFADMIRQALKEYADEAMTVINDTIEEVAKDTTKQVKANASVFKGKTPKGWTTTAEKGRLSTAVTVHGRGKTASVAHLMENGHAKRGGGRVAGRTVIAPADTFAAEQLEQRIIKRREELK